MKTKTGITEKFLSYQERLESSLGTIDSIEGDEEKYIRGAEIARAAVTKIMEEYNVTVEQKFKNYFDLSVPR